MTQLSQILSRLRTAAPEGTRRVPESTGLRRQAGSGVRALGASEELFSVMTAHTPVGVFVSNVEGACVYVNERWCELAGLSPAQAMGDGWSSVLHPEDAERVGAEWAIAAAAGRDSIIEYRFRRPDGEVVWIQGFAAALRDDAGEVLGWVGTCLDLTDRKEAERAILHESERFRAAFDDAPIGMALVAPDGTFLRVNQSLSAILGYSEADLLQRSFQELTHPDDLELDLEHAERVLAGELRTYQLEKRYRRADNEIVWTKLSVSLVRTSDGAPLYFVSQIEDITAQKEAERVLQHLADHDSLTGLLNRRRFYEELHLHLEKSDNTGRQAAILLLDVDRFKLVNDSLGHLAGDEVLRAFADTLTRRLRTNDVVARLGGDEFAALLLDVETEQAGAQIADDVASAIRQQTVPTPAGPANVTASIGVVTFRPTPTDDADDLLAAADRALYLAKRHGRDRIESVAAHD
jgi:diguanylate cyclase (GGDEF)-like protein/PAS domain S-box-containing protein